MKKPIFFLFLVISVLRGAQAQSHSTDGDSTATLKVFLVDPSYYVFYVLKSETQREEILIGNTENITDLMDPNNIESIEVFKHENAIQAYGQKAAHGAIVIHFKHEFKKLPKDQNDRFIRNGN